MKLSYPKTIHPQTKKFMNAVLKKLNGVRAVEDCDQGGLHMLMVSYDMYIKASHELLEKGPVLYDKRGQATVNPAAKLTKSYYSQVIAFMKEFGLTVKARERIRAMTPEVDQDNDIMRFLRGENVDE